MSYRDFKFPDVVERLSLELYQEPLFADAAPFELSQRMLESLDSGLKLSNTINNEKARSEFVVAPLLLELWQRFAHSFGLFSGWELNVDQESGLVGICDFILAREPMMLMLRSPVLAIVVARNDHVRNGFGQCISSMHAAQLYNKTREEARTGMYGASTTGAQWQLFRLDGKRLIVDTSELNLMADTSRVAGILMDIVHTSKGTS